MKIKNIFILLFAILLIFSCKTKPTESVNTAPTINSIIAIPNTIPINGTSIITCIATDEDGDSLIYSWESLFGLISGDENQIQWTAPDSIGNYYISCTVNDGNDEITDSIKVIVLFEQNFNNILDVPLEYSTIQTAIDASVNGDTILVAAGTYYENINFNGKEIVVASNFIIDQNEEHISNTIIDGANKASVVTFENSETENTKLIGFTIQNGKKTYRDYLAYDIMGGGIFCKESDPTLTHLNIINNVACQGGGLAFINSRSELDYVNIKNNEVTIGYETIMGGGIIIKDSDMIIKNTIIAHNKNIATDGSNYPGGDYSSVGGINITRSDIHLSNVSIHHNSVENGHYGGLVIGGNSNITFDNQNRCSIYSNSAKDYQDIIYFGNTTLNVILDTFTVNNPTDYYAHPIGNFTFDIQNSFIDLTGPTDSDLYVNVKGDDSNIGTSATEPLKTITHALSIIITDSQNPHTIFIANGTYSATSNDERFPLKLIDNISLVGESEEGVVIDAERNAIAVESVAIGNSSIKHLTIQNGVDYFHMGGGINVNNSDVKLKNITVKDCYGSCDLGLEGGGISIWDSTIEMDSISIIKNSISGLHIRNSQMNLSNSFISDNGYGNAWGGGIDCGGDISLNNVIIQNNYGREGGGISCRGDVVLSNVIIANNVSDYRGGGILAVGNLTINSNTIVNNRVKYANPPHGSGGNIAIWGAEIEIKNSILWNGNPNNILIDDIYYGQDTSAVSISYSNIQNGESGIESQNGFVKNWLDGNIDADPLFIDPDNSDFHLQPASPCIDTGNPDAQYNDVDGSRNDMGAYGGPGGDW